MPTYTTNYHLAKPLVNSAVDQDLWGDELNSDMDIIDSTMKSIADSVITLDTIYPIGSVYINYSDNTNPGTLFGFGTWVSLQDRFLIGAGGTYSAGSTGGATTHTLTPGEIPALTFTLALGAAGSGSSTSRAAPGDASLNQPSTNTITSNAGGGAHSILNPYVAVYMWRRTA